MKEIKDTEIRVLGGSGNVYCCESTSDFRRERPNCSQNEPPRKGPHHRPKWYWWAIGGALIAMAIGTLVLYIIRHPKEPEQTVFEKVEKPVQSHPLRGWVAYGDSLTGRGTLTYDTIVNDIPLKVMRPINATPHLEVGYKCLSDTLNIVLMFQAADVRADNMKIVGAFVLHGKPLSWGLSKRGYCAIIDQQVTVGVADNSPLFEEATERNGDFFRQYPLVDNGVLVENELKAKFVRRALCELEGCIVVVETGTPESMHDFAQALVDIGVSNAIYLVGSTAIAWYKDMDGVGHPSGAWGARIYKNISFILWQ